MCEIEKDTLGKESLCSTNGFSRISEKVRFSWRENQSFSQIVFHVFSGKFLKINRFEGIFPGYLKGDYWFLGC